MSTIDALGGSSNPQSTSVSGFSSLSSEEFVEIIFAELTNQDPLEPNDSKALIDQLSSLRAIESDIALTDNLNALVQQTQFAAAAGLVGQVVGGLTTSGERVLDLVVSVSNTAENGAVLNLFDGDRIPFANIEQILGPLETEPEPEPEPEPVDEDEEAPGDDDDTVGETTNTTGASAATSGDDDQTASTQTAAGAAP
ncbi:MAG: flagellar hook capping FlgD N-terminal domain-containing protein [Phycisphaerales bacterium JB059]